MELEAQEPNRKYLAGDLTAITGRSKCTEARQLKTLWEQGKLNREWKDRQYFYSLVNSSKTVSQAPLSDPKNQDQ